MNLNMRAVDMACILLLVVAVAAGGFFLQQNFSHHSSHVKLEKEELSTQENSLNLAVEKLAKLESQFKEQEDRVLELNKRVPKAPGMGDLLSQVHGLVKQRNINLIDFNHKPAQGFERYKLIPVQVIVKGDFLNIYRLIHDLETLNRVLIFEKIMIKKQDGKNLCQATFMASVFQQ
ncbi:MAG: type 4a pilus biogenesis protein PilO [Deltaproteobacteria bacterium]|uniref:type 4a pilus biogenesis protein PilO n=1 Tax=Desulfobacula sp. TaxID=2593537 RepID=UPI0019863965|nr:type 4a pilus biogenesis protein PilO [Candidatus Desulfobacula maris]MBL6993209.1 type 4a pilus biogenesis protein PilO [Desulfobacula sp.]